MKEELILLELEKNYKEIKECNRDKEKLSKLKFLLNNKVEEKKEEVKQAENFRKLATIEVKKAQVNWNNGENINQEFLLESRKNLNDKNLDLKLKKDERECLYNELEDLNDYIYYLNKLEKKQKLSEIYDDSIVKKEVVTIDYEQYLNSFEAEYDVISSCDRNLDSIKTALNSLVYSIKLSKDYINKLKVEYNEASDNVKLMKKDIKESKKNLSILNKEYEKKLYSKNENAYTKVELEEIKLEMISIGNEIEQSNLFYQGLANKLENTKIKLEDKIKQFNSQNELKLAINHYLYYLNTFDGHLTYLAADDDNYEIEVGIKKIENSNLEIFMCFRNVVKLIKLQEKVSFTLSMINEECKKLRKKIENNDLAIQLYNEKIEETKNLKIYLDDINLVIKGINKIIKNENEDILDNNNQFSSFELIMLDRFKNGNLKDISFEIMLNKVIVKCNDENIKMVCDIFEVNLGELYMKLLESSFDNKYECVKNLAYNLIENEDYDILSLIHQINKLFVNRYGKIIRENVDKEDLKLLSLLGEISKKYLEIKDLSQELEEEKHLENYYDIMTVFVETDRDLLYLKKLFNDSSFEKDIINVYSTKGEHIIFYIQNIIFESLSEGFKLKFSNLKDIEINLAIFNMYMNSSKLKLTSDEKAMIYSNIAKFLRGKSDMLKSENNISESVHKFLKQPDNEEPKKKVSKYIEPLEKDHIDDYEINFILSDEKRNSSALDRIFMFENKDKLYNTSAYSVSLTEDHNINLKVHISDSTSWIAVGSFYDGLLKTKPIDNKPLSKNANYIKSMNLSASKRTPVLTFDFIVNFAGEIVDYDVYKGNIVVSDIFNQDSPIDMNTAALINYFKRFNTDRVLTYEEIITEFCRGFVSQKYKTFRDREIHRKYKSAKMPMIYKNHDERTIDETQNYFTKLNYDFGKLPMSEAYKFAQAIIEDKNFAYYSTENNGHYALDDKYCIDLFAPVNNYGRILIQRGIVDMMINRRFNNEQWANTYHNYAKEANECLVKERSKKLIVE